MDTPPRYTQIYTFEQLAEFNLESSQHEATLETSSTRKVQRLPLDNRQYAWAFHQESKKLTAP